MSQPFSQARVRVKLSICNEIACVLSKPKFDQKAYIKDFIFSTQDIIEEESLFIIFKIRKKKLL